MGFARPRQSHHPNRLRPNRSRGHCGDMDVSCPRTESQDVPASALGSPHHAHRIVIAVRVAAAAKSVMWDRRRRRFCFRNHPRKAGPACGHVGRFNARSILLTDRRELAMLRKIINEGDLQNRQRELFGEGGQRRLEASPDIANTGLFWRTIPPISSMDSPPARTGGLSCRYNRRWRHLSLGYRSPESYEGEQN